MDCREKILSDDYLDFITDYEVSDTGTDMYDMCYLDVSGIYNIIYINRIGIPEITDSFYNYQNIPNLYGLMDISALQSGTGVFDATDLYQSGILQVQRSPLSLTGRGTVICIIDTGINFADRVFQDENGDTRILAIWDQTLQEGVPPEGYLYGTEYSREDINRALATASPYELVPSRDTNGHGSAIAAVAAGSVVDSGYGYIGAAPDAEIVVVKLKEAKPYLRDFYHVPQSVPAYQENDIMLAVEYAESFALTFNRPVIICIGVGTNMGDHAGNSPLSRYLSYNASKRSRAVVVCGGNEGNSSHHYQGELGIGQGGAGKSENVEIRVGENSRGFYMEMWGTVPDTFNLTVRSPGGEIVPPLRLSVTQSITYSFIYE
ncbi:MAG: S8 family peptidase, partial [Lachnospiraceae bacterium]|nr:S8 family peptidase [Lachnospiraceae bacterium]